MMALRHYFSVVHENHFVALSQVLLPRVNKTKQKQLAVNYLKLVSDKHYCFVFQHSPDAVIENVLTHVAINRAQWIIQQVQVSIKFKNQFRCNKDDLR